MLIIEKIMKNNSDDDDGYEDKHIPESKSDYKCKVYNNGKHVLVLVQVFDEYHKNIPQPDNLHKKLIRPTLKVTIVFS